MTGSSSQSDDSDSYNGKARIAFFGGSFDPPHRGHFAIARALIEIFELDAFVFVPAFHAPHKPDQPPTPAIHRYAMLAIATNSEPKMRVSTIEIDAPQRPFTFQTLESLKNALPEARIFFVMGADSWRDITTWRNWEQVLSSVDHIVVTRPGFSITFDHIPDGLRERIVDLRGNAREDRARAAARSIFITDAVSVEASATGIRADIGGDVLHWRKQITEEVAKYIEKYELYK